MTEASAVSGGAETAAADAAGAAVASRLAALYATIAERSMRDLPVYNPRLRVEAVGFRRHGDRVVGVLATPWFMNLVVTAASDDAPLAPHPTGASVTHAFAGGEFDFVVGALDGFGRVDGASLFSPMFDFDDPDVVRAVAEAAIAEVVTAPQPETPAPPAPASEAPRLDRRALLFGRRKEEASCR